MIVEAPFTNDQLLAILKYQYSGMMHPFTCVFSHIYAQRVGKLPRELKSKEFNAIDRSGILEEDEHFETSHVLLMPTENGMVCPVQNCNYTQDWVHVFMADLEAVENTIERNKELFGPPLSRRDLKELEKEFEKVGQEHEEI